MRPGGMASATLSVFVPMVEETSFIARFLGAIDLFWIWWCVSVAIGVGVLFKRKTGGIAMTFLGIYVRDRPAARHRAGGELTTAH